MSFRIREATEPPEAAALLLAGDPRATFFLDPVWLEALRHAYPRFRPLYLLLEEDGVATGYLGMAETRPFGWREWVSMPFGTHGGPVLAPGAGAAGRDALVAAFAERAHRRRTVRYELTAFDPTEDLLGTLGRFLGDHVVPTRTWVLDLRPGIEQLQASYDQRLRRSLRIAGRADIWVREVSGAEGLRRFHRLYAGQAGTWNLTWHHSLDALERLAEALGPRMRLWLAGREDEDLCGQLVLYHGERELHFWLSGASPASRPVAAYHCMLHGIIRDATERGIGACHFGTSLGDRGIERFKRAFGSQERTLFRFHHQPRWLDGFQRIRWRPSQGEQT